ncbi:ubiquinol-cytochrome C reductase complex core protein 2 [Ephemerocybe angulata]|uniref:Cytochrome b-c1 complex subunit 2, mitochondrial n=1 Tax=Ephemerocybe angulata TaxID=980116 RepID=A0A8H6HRA0_9AGAR|nr:ubiquinol-cytochrome C reductase complex core protein 2 [Tulosesus angulatus]
MFAARVSARNVQRAARSFATVVESSGVKVAAVENGAPTSSLTVLVKAGSRYEPKEGVANALKNFAFKSTAKRTALGTVRESDLYGGVLSSSLGREHLALSAEFLKGDEDVFVDILTSFITSAKFTRHEFNEYVAPLISNDTAAAAANPAIQAIELAHAIAFRQGLASSLYAPAHPSIGLKDIQDYAAKVFTKENIAVVGTGIEQSKLTELVNKAFANAASSSGPTSSSTRYFGGENRIEGTGPQTAFIGFGTTGAPSAEVATLAAYLNPSPSVKWSKGTSPIAAALPEGASVQSVYLPYSDASLVGLLVQAPTAAALKEAGSVAVSALKKAASGISQEELASAVARARFAAASAADARAGVVEAIGAKIFSGSEISLASTLSAFDAVDASAFSKAAAELVKAKPTYVAVGDIVSLPYADELGL